MSAIVPSSRGRRAARALVWPLRRALDPRFADVVRRVVQLSEDVRREAAETRSQLSRTTAAMASNTAALVELAGHVGDRLDRFDAAVDDIEGRIAALETELDGAGVAERLRAAALGGPEELDEEIANFLDLAAGSDGPAARSGVLVPGPIRISHAAGRAEIEEVTRTAVEEPWALRSLGALAAGSRVHVATSMPSALPVALAVLGYDVETAAPPVIAHPGLSLEHRARSCAAAIALGVLDEGDRSKRLGELRATLGPGGLLVLGIRVGVAADAEQDLLDPAAVETLLEGWTVQERLDVARTSATTWEISTVIPTEGLALVRARSPGG